MQYGIVLLSVVALRNSPDSQSGLVTMALYGASFKIIDQRKYWFKIRLDFDATEGWVEKNQLYEISEERYLHIQNTPPSYCQELTGFISKEDGSLMPVLLGAHTRQAALLNHSFEGNTSVEASKYGVIHTALLYLNAPYLQGGMSPFGIDAAGLCQMAYKLNGYTLYRTAQEQSKQGEPLSFIEESEAGDLAFFDNAEGLIDHVGIILPDNHIIHCHGQVRIDRLDHTGIFNPQSNQYSHSLRVIKKVI